MTVTWVGHLGDSGSGGDWIFWDGLMETLEFEAYIPLLKVGPHVSAGLAGLRVLAWYFLACIPLPVGHNYVPAPEPAGTRSHPYLHPTSWVPTSRRIFLARRHL
jgi:hypothetical protein